MLMLPHKSLSTYRILPLSFNYILSIAANFVAVKALAFLVITSLTTPAMAVVNFPNTSTQPQPTPNFPSVGRVISDVDNVNENGNAEVGTGFVLASASILRNDGFERSQLEGHVIVTAAHVVKNQFQWFQQHDSKGTLINGGSYAGLKLPHPGYQLLPAGNALNDLALIITERAIITSSGMELSSHRPSEGDPVAFLGNGGGDRSRETRLGIGRYSGPVDSNIVHISPEFQNAQPGDSGGPVLGVSPDSPMLHNRVFAINSALDAGRPGFQATAIDSTSPLNTFARGYNNIHVRPNRDDEYQFDAEFDSDFHRWSRFSDKVLFSSLTSASPADRAWTITNAISSGERGTYRGAPKVLGLLNNDQLDLIGGTTRGIHFESGGIHLFTPVTQSMTNEQVNGGSRYISARRSVLEVGSTGILNGESGRLRVIGGVLTAPTIHNRGEFYVASAMGRRLPGFGLNAPEFEMWGAGVKISEAFLQEGHLTLDGSSVTIDSGFTRSAQITDEGEDLQATASTLTAPFSGDFIQSTSGVLDIYWDEEIYRDLAPISVSGDLTLAGQINIHIPDAIGDFADESLRLFQVAGKTTWSDARMTIFFRDATAAFTLRESNGNYFAMRVPEPGSIFVCAACALVVMTMTQRGRSERT